MTEDRQGQVDRLAQLAVEVAANVAEGQTLFVRAHLPDAPLVHGIACAAYRRGAYQVEVDWTDPSLQKIRLQDAPDVALGQVAPWRHDIPLALGEMHGSAIRLLGNPTPGLLDDLDAGRIGRDASPVTEWRTVYDRQTINWTAMPSPTPGWASLVYPELDDAAALTRLWSDISHICRLDTPDPAAAWRTRAAELSRLAQKLTAASLESLRFLGPGTDLRIGLLPGVSWAGGGPAITVWGREHLTNLPTEEVFTSPDPERTEGIVRATKPLLVNGRAVTGLRVRFERGRVVAIDAEDGAEVLSNLCSRDIGAARLGDVALVDASGRIGDLDTTFHNVLLDENAASHIALGNGFSFLGGDPQATSRLNRSAIHTDLMIGGPGILVSGRTRDGRDVEVLDAAGTWQLF